MNDRKTEEEVDLRQYKRSPNFITIYTNNVNFAFTGVDVQMIVSRTVASMEKNTTGVEEVATIIMTPHHAKAVLEALQGNILAYEAKHGKIIMPNVEAKQQPAKSESQDSTKEKKKQ